MPAPRSTDRRALQLTETPVQIEVWQEQFAPVARRLRVALRGVVEDVFGSAARAQDLMDAFDLGRTMSYRLIRALGLESPVDLALAVPGRPTMQRLISRAAALCGSPELAEELGQAYGAFTAEVDRVASTQQELAALLSAHDPNLLRVSAERQRSALYRAMADFWGGYIESASYINVILPREGSPAIGDCIFAHAYFGLRRLGSMNPITVEAYSLASGAEGDAAGTSRRLDGASVVSGCDGMIVRELSSESLPRVSACATPTSTVSVIMGDDIPQGESLDIASASYLNGMYKNIQPGNFGTEFINRTVHTPIKLCVGDYLIHRTMWPGIEPVLKLYATGAIPGNPFPDDLWYREVAQYDELQPVPARALSYPVSQAPRHTELVRYVVDRLEPDLDEFRAYRLIMRYPVVGHSACVFFSRKEQSLSASHSAPPSTSDA